MTAPELVLPPDSGGELFASFCGHCGFTQLAERRCDRCRAETLRRPVSGVGVVLASTLVERAPEDVLLDTPFLVALVQLDDGPQLLAVAQGRSEFVPGAVVSITRRLIERDGERALAELVQVPSALGGS